MKFCPVYSVENDHSSGGGGVQRSTMMTVEAGEVQRREQSRTTPRRQRPAAAAAAAERAALSRCPASLQPSRLQLPAFDSRKHFRLSPPAYYVNPSRRCISGTSDSSVRAGGAQSPQLLAKCVSDCVIFVQTTHPPAGPPSDRQTLAVHCQAAADRRYVRFCRASSSKPFFNQRQRRGLSARFCLFLCR